VEAAGGGGRLKIVLDVERLVLDGFALERRDMQAVRAAVTLELTRLLGNAALPHGLAAGGSHRSVAAPPIRVDAVPAPVQLGRDIAASVHRGLAR
jgi:hypothetical protein